MDVLLIEDEPKISSAIQSALKKEGYQVELISSFEDLDHFIDTTKIPPLVLMDRLLKGKDSLKLLSKIRARAPSCGVIILSAIGSVGEKASALDLGADDYMSKPFSITELISRVRALERRSHRAAGDLYLEIGNTLIDVGARTVGIEGRRINLTNKEFLLLKSLCQSPGRVFSKTQLFEIVWEMNSSTETNVVEATLTGLRRKLEDAQSSLKIRNTRNVGYWIEGDSI